MRDSQFINVGYAIPVNPSFLPSMVIDNLNLINVGYLVFVTGGVEYLSGEVGPITINSWAMGPRYTNSDGMTLIPSAS